MELNNSISKIADACEMELRETCSLHPRFEVRYDRDYDFKSNSRLMAYIWNNYIDPVIWGKYYSKGKRHYYSKATKDFHCPTGYCADYILWEAWREFIEDIRKAKKVLSLDDFADVLTSHARKEIDDNYDNVTSDEYIKDIFIANDYEFLEDGTDY